MGVIKAIFSFVSDNMSYVYILIILSICGMVAYLWNDYQDAKKENVTLSDSINNYKSLVKQLNEDNQSLKDINKISGVTIFNLQQRNNTLEKQAKIDEESFINLKRPANEKDCTVHPAIKRAIDIVRSRTTAADNSKH